MQNNSSRKTVLRMKSVGSTHKKQHDEDDIINKLPESVISHIFSFLPTKDAVRTSVLSKRWIDKWTLITNVNLDDDLFYYPKRKKSGGKQHFITFVNRVLFLTSYSLESFSFTINNEYDITLLNTWISCIMKKSVRKLRITTNFEFPFSDLTSHYLFSNSSSIKKLALEMCGCAIIKVPRIQSVFYFKSLKRLKLWEITFNIENSLGLNLNLPLLKTFETENCTWLCAKNGGVTIEAPRLKRVYILQGHTCVSREPHSCTIKFSASCMAEFTYCGYGGISERIVLSNPSVAHNASVNINLYRYEAGYVQETGSRVCLLLEQFSQVQFMKFHGSEVLLMQQNVTMLPLFLMLSYLKLHLVTGDILISLLQKSPVLKTLHIERLIYGFDQETLNSSVVPDCLTTTLEVVKFNRVDATQDVLYLTKFFMENAMVLERMSFSWYLEVKDKEIHEFKEKVLSFKKGVSSIIFEFSYD